MKGDGGRDSVETKVSKCTESTIPVLFATSIVFYEGHAAYVRVDMVVYRFKIKPRMPNSTT